MNNDFNTSRKGLDQRGQIWIAAIVMVLTSGGFSAFLTGYAPGTGPPTEAGYSVITQYGIAAGAMGCLFILFLYRPFLLARGFWLLVAAILPFASILWSVDYYQTFRATILLYSSLLSALAIAFYFSPNEIIRIAIRITIMILFASLTVIMLFPTYGVHSAVGIIAPVYPNPPGDDVVNVGKWRGIFSHKNQFGEAMGICLILSVMIRRMWLPARLGLLVLVIVSLVFARSASPVVFCLFAFIVAAFISPRCFTKTGTAILRLVGILSLFGICVLIFSGLSLDLPLDFIGRDLTLSGRVPAWYYVLDHLNGPLVLGLGYITGYQELLYPSIYFILGPEFFHIHNGFLDTYIGLGLVGLSLFLFLALSALRRAMIFVKSSEPDFRDLGRIAVVLVLYYLLSSCTDVMLSRGGNPIFPMTFLFIATITVHRPRLNYQDLGAPLNDARKSRTHREGEEV